MGTVDSMLFLRLLLLLSSLVLAQAFIPWAAGPYTPTHKLYNGLVISGLDHELDVWMPDAAGSFPVLYFLPGFGGAIPAGAYGTVMNRVASFGYIVIGPWGLSLDSEENFMAEWLVGVQDWVEENLENRLHNDGFNGDLHLDNDILFLVAHSAGSHIGVEYLKHHCNKVKGMVVFSPVDGADPFGFIDIFAITPGEYLNYDTPTLIVMGGLDSIPGINLIPACAPEDMSNMRFYNAMPGPTWLVNATAYGHADMVDEFYYDLMQATHFCATDASQDRDIFRAFVAGEVVSFMEAILKRDCDALTFFSDHNSLPVESQVLQKSEVTGSGWECGMPTYCNWQEGPYPRLH